MRMMRTVGCQTCSMIILVFLVLTVVALPRVSRAAAGDAENLAAKPEPPTVEQTVIERIESSPTPRGHMVTIVGSRPLHYKVFNLADPPRLLLTFASARLGPMVQPMLLEASDIVGIFPSQTENGEVKLEIGLKKNLTPDIVAEGHRIVITIAQSNPSASFLPEAQGVETSVMEMQTTVQIKGIGPGPKPKVYKLLNPPRIVMDLAGFKGPANSKTDHVTSPEVKSVTLAADREKTRLIVTLKSPDIRYELTSIQGLPALILSQPRINADPTPGQASQVEDVSFERDGNNALIHIATSLRKSGIQTSRVDADLKLLLPNMQLPQRLSRRMDVTQFASPVNAIDTYAKNNAVHLTVRLAHPAALHEVVETPREILIRVRPQKALETDKGNQKFEYTGKKISMDFKDINIHNALKLIADVSQLNIILADTVTGNLTMRLVEVPWDQALDLILAAKGLGKEVQGNVVRIAPLTEIQTAADAKRKTLASQQQLEPFVTELIPVSFANAADIVTLLKEGVNNEQQNTRLLSAGGSVSLDTRTSTLIIKDIPNNIANIRELIAKLDKPTAQVLIEARIVWINRSSGNSLGISWGAAFKPKANSTFGIADTADNASTVYQATSSSAVMAKSTMVNLGGTASAPGKIGFHMGTLSPLLDLDVELAALETSNKAKTISSPRILTMDNQQASITQGTKVPYQTQSSSGGTTTQFVDASLNLQVTPHVTPNGYISLKVTVTDNSVGSFAAGSTPPINTREVTTQALVMNSETIVLGGIFTKSDTVDNSSIPGFSKIPVLGDMLFKSNTETDGQSELLIFITPRVAQSGAS